MLDVPAGVRRLGPYMCVPYGKILADEVVPNTVTKTLHADKVYAANMENFSILEAPVTPPCPVRSGPSNPSAGR